MTTIKEFQGEYRFLSNFAPVDVVYEGVEYRSVEAAYQSAKVINPEDKNQFQNALPHQAKQFGRNLIEIRPDWNDVKDDIMYGLLKQKFFNNSYYTNALLNTTDIYIEEGNLWGDKYWGIDIKTGEGQNRLGKMLMDIRSELETIKLNEQRIQK